MIPGFFAAGASAGAAGGGSYADDYASIFAAWSAEKVVIRGYTGPLIRIRRSSDNTEQDIGSVSGVLDTAAISSFVGANSAYVTTVYKQVGASVTDITQVTSINQPRIVNAGTLETNYAQCDGIDDYLEATITGGMNVSVATLFFHGLVGTTNSISDGGGVISIDFETAGKVGLLVYSAGPPSQPGVGFAMSGGNTGPYLVRSFLDATRPSRNAAYKFTARYNLDVSATDDTALHAYQSGSDAFLTTTFTGDPGGTFNGTVLSIGRMRYASSHIYNNTGFRTLILVASDALSVRADIEAVM